MTSASAATGDLGGIWTRQKTKYPREKCFPAAALSNDDPNIPYFSLGESVNATQQSSGRKGVLQS